jgi:signal transduction histidine kinase
VSRRAWLYIWLNLIVGAVLAGLALSQPIPSAEAWPAFGVLTIGATLAQLSKALFRSQVRSSRGTVVYTPSFVFMFAGILMLPPALFALLVIIPRVIDWARERLRRSANLPNWYIQPFNIATLLTTGLVVQWLYLQLAPYFADGVEFILLVLLASLYTALNHYLIGQVLVLARQVAWRETGVWRVDTLLADFFMLLYGSIIPSLWNTNPWLIVPAVSPLYLIQRALAVPQIRQDEQELQRAKAELELRVAERTQELQQAYQTLQAVSQQLMQAQEAERTKIARELHDQIGQALTVVKINLQTVQHSLNMTQPIPRIEESIRSVERAMELVRDLSRDLRPTVLDDLGLGPALRSYIDRQAEVSGLVPEVIVNPSDLRAPPDVETACFRVVQEAVTNIMRHAQARRVCVELKKCDSELELVVRDDGVGFDSQRVQELIDREGRLGLLGIQERIALVGGQVTIRSAPGHGTEITAQVPLARSGNGQPTTLRRMKLGAN